jgi:hypothetical protein
MEHILLQWGPLILIVVVFILQNHIFITPVELEKKHREILKDIESKYVTNKTFENLKEQFKEMKDTINKIYEILVNERNMEG